VEEGWTDVRWVDGGWWMREQKNRKEKERKAEGCEVPYLYYNKLWRKGREVA